MKFKDLPIGASFTNEYWKKFNIGFTKTALDEKHHDIVWNIPPAEQSRTGNRDGQPAYYGQLEGEVELVSIEEIIP